MCFGSLLFLKFLHIAYTGWLKKKTSSIENLNKIETRWLIFKIFFLKTRMNLFPFENLKNLHLSQNTHSWKMSFQKRSRGIEKKKIIFANNQPNRHVLLVIRRRIHFVSIFYPQNFGILIACILVVWNFTYN